MSAAEPADDVTDPRDPRIVAAVAFIGATGAHRFVIRYSEADEPAQPDDGPVVWLALAGYPDGLWETGAALNPLRATLRLCERLADGGVCQHCDRPCGFDSDTVGGEMPMDNLVCWYQFDPGAARFIRGCD